MSKANSARAAGFTLMELLIIIALLALLTSILLPTIWMAQEIFRRHICQVNQRGIAESMQIWREERQSERLPAPSVWPQELLAAQIVTNPEQFICPSDREAGDRYGGAGRDQLYLRILGYSGETLYDIYLFDGNQNVRITNQDKDANSYEVWIEDLTPSRADWDYDIRLRITEVNGGLHCLVIPGTPAGYTHDLYRGSELLLRNVKTQIGAEMTLLEKLMPCSYGMNSLVSGPIENEQQWLLLDYDRQVADVDGRGNYEDVLNETLAPRHLGMVNVAHIDGSVEAMYPHELSADEPLWRKAP